MQTVDQQPRRDRGMGPVSWWWQGRGPGTHTHVHCHVRHVQNDTRFNGASQLQPSSSCSSTRCAPDTLIDATAAAAAADAHANGTTVGGGGESGHGSVHCELSGS